MLQSRAINENITVSYIPMGKLKTTTVGFYVHCPLNKKTASKNALLAAILKQGTRAYPSKQALTRKLDELYGSTLSASVSKKGEDHILTFDAECISDKYIMSGEKLLDELLSVLFGVIFEPKCENGAFDEQIFVQEKKNLVDRIKAIVNEKRAYANERLIEITSEGSGYAVSRLGDADTVSGLDNSELFSYYKNMITSSKIDVYVAGDADINAVCDRLTLLAANLDFTNGKIPDTKILEGKKEVKTVTDKMEVTQGKLAMSFVTGIDPTSEEQWGLTVANSIFGGGAHSKLFNNVREKLSLAYYAGSQLHKLKGFIAVNAGVEFENFQKAYDEIILQLDELKKGVISEQEFTASKMALINSLNSYYDDQLYMQGFYLGEKIAGTNYDIDYYIE
ncbi:MAG: insulinase family protein, partial [Clostridia bacterium]|nr:insulinase family protein [Clostridia bacterium]